MVAYIIIAVVAVFVVAVVARTIRIVPQARAGVIERFGATTERSRLGSRSSFRSSTACDR